jgi:hypothetical protein
MGKAHEHASKVLFQGYVALIHTFKQVQDMVLKGEIRSVAELQSISYSMFSKTFASRVGLEISIILPKLKESFSAIVKGYDAMGNEVPLFDY